MKSSRVVGKKIVEVRHERVPKDPESSRPAFVHVASLLLEDGTVVVTHAEETETSPRGDLLVYKAKDRQQAQKYRDAKRFRDRKQRGYDALLEAARRVGVKIGNQDDDVLDEVGLAQADVEALWRAIRLVEGRAR